MTALRAVIVMDYQNVHLTGYEMFGKGQGLATHEALIHPLHFAHQLIHARNRAQRPGADHAELSRILAYRGEPHVDHDPKPYAWNQAQKAEWERGGHTQTGVMIRVLQRVLALTAAIWHNWHTDQPVMRSLVAFDH